MSHHRGCSWMLATLVSAGSAYAQLASPAATAPVLPSASALPEMVDAGGPAAAADKAHADGVRLLRERRIEPAIIALEQAVALDDKSALFATDLGYAYLVGNRLGEAEAAFKQGIALDPTRPHAYGHLVECILREPTRWEKRAELFRILDQGIRNNSERERRHKLEIARIRAERGFGLLDRAREHIQEALRDHPSRSIEKQLLDLKLGLVDDDNARRAIRDWPEPEVSEPAKLRYQQCEQLTRSHARKECLTCLNEVLDLFPAWRAPRHLRVKVLTEQGHYDEAVKELSTLVRLEPSEPSNYRQLGLLLAAHGGLLELERADQALHMAQALEPEWADLAQVRQTLAARRFDTQSPNRSPQPRPPEPTENARRLYEEAETSLESGPENRQSALALLDQALRESPAFVEAAALWFSQTRKAPEKTVEALWHDGALLTALYQECAHVEPALPRTVLERWLNRAIALGSTEARLARALSLRSRGDRSAAERELANYMALVSNREEVESVQQLRTEMLEKPRSPTGLLDEAILNARVRLKSDDPDGALRQLDAPCRAPQEPERLLWLGIVYEQKADTSQALQCYEIALGEADGGNARARIARRFARLLARSDVKYLLGPSAERLAPLASLEPAADWALGRRAIERGQADVAKAHIAGYLKRAADDDTFVAQARAAQQQLVRRAEQSRARQQRQLKFGAAGGAAGLGLVALLVYFIGYRGLTAARAVRRFPRLYPELRRLIGQLRHDVLKHRTSALGLLAQDPSALEQIRRTLLEPMPVSTVVEDVYSKLVAAARARGVRLRRLAREPVFGALVKDLQLIERALTHSPNEARLRALDSRLRNVHSEALQRLLAEGPRFQMTAVAIHTWIASLQAELTGRSEFWCVPALQMSAPMLQFPLDESSLFQIFTNLLRNAEAAVSHVNEPRLLVRMLSETDFTGRSWVKLQIEDNADGILNETHIENSPADRGLGIIRDTVRDWHGRIVFGTESAPYRKVISVEFAL